MNGAEIEQTAKLNDKEIDYWRNRFDALIGQFQPRELRSCLCAVDAYFNTAEGAAALVNAKRAKPVASYDKTKRIVLAMQAYLNATTKTAPTPAPESSHERLTQQVIEGRERRAKELEATRARIEGRKKKRHSMINETYLVVAVAMLGLAVVLPFVVHGRDSKKQ